MRKPAIILLIGILFLITNGFETRGSKYSQISDQGNNLQQNDKQVKIDASVKIVYTCPMHPEILQDKPGKCPKCGMNLIKKEVPKDVYTCSMHPEVLQDKPGKCPKCGMNLIKKESPKKVETRYK